MKIYYIENSFKHVRLLRMFTKSNVDITLIKSINDLKDDGVLITSNDCIEYEEIIKNVTNVLVWEDIFKMFYEYSYNRYMSNYDYYYLKYSLERALQPDIKALVVGSSYARFGIEESILNVPCINLALASQDIYYGCLIGRYVINKNPNIKKIFIGTGYYSFYSDLSLNKGEELTRISDVYYPIFKDVHNCKDLPKGQNNNLDDNELFDIKKIVDIFSSDLFKQFGGNYFIDIRNRVRMRMNLIGAENLKWFEIDESYRKRVAYERANAHNKSNKYVGSYKENKEIINSFVKYCNERNVEVCMVAFPSTKFYEETILKEHKENYMEALNSIDGELHFIDFNDLDIFTDEDFVDMDHLDKSGAIKISKVINELNI